MRMQRIHEAVYFQPWFITAAGYASVRSLVDRNILKKKNENSKEEWDQITEDFVRQRPEMEIDEDGFAHISVYGVTAMHLSNIEKSCGNTGYDQIIEEIKMATKRGVGGFFFNFDSGGGMVQGCDEAARAISSIKVPTVAFCETYMCSAAYYMGSGCNQIVATSTAVIGNIGTICPWIDESKMWEVEGLEFDPIVSDGAELKSTFHGPSITNEQRQFLQDNVNNAARMFRDHVSMHRDVEDEVWRAGWYSGEEAQMLGLIDEVGDEQEAMDLLKMI